ncbi:MAG: MBL fold metallo-hydrolase [Rhizobiaceae bacterium]
MTQDNAELLRPAVYQFKLGDMIITQILEGYLHRNDLHPFVATNATAQDVETVAKANHLPFPAMEHGFVCTVIETPDRLIVVDPGFGAIAPAPTTGLFKKGFEQAGYRAEDVNIVLISHCHPDHIGNVVVDGTLTFANAQVVIGKSEYDYWKAAESISEMRKPTLGLFQKTLMPMESQLKFMEPGDEISAGVTAVNAFGHSAGHMVFHLSSRGHDLLMLNDTTPHYIASFANPEWNFLMDDDPDAAAVTRRRILEQAASDALPVTGFHIPFPAIGYVERDGGGFAFRPATYQFNLG